jgi:hypothetical protein
LRCGDRIHPSVIGGWLAIDVEVRPLAEDDSPGLAACVERCYGDTYPKRALYRVDELAALIRTGDYCGVVAVAGSEIVGHIGHSRPFPAATVLEAGTTIVDPRLRGRGLMARMAQGWAASLPATGAAGFIHFPTTAHTVMQRAATESGRETGILLAYIPQKTRDRSLAAVGVGVWPSRSSTSRWLLLRPSRSLSRRYMRPGSASSPRRCSSWAVEVLRGAGFAYGAWLPGWKGHDVLRIQLVRGPTDEELTPSLYTSAARAMCWSIRDELTVR